MSLTVLHENETWNHLYFTQVAAPVTSDCTSLDQFTVSEVFFSMISSL